MQVKAIDGTVHEISMDEARRVFAEASKPHTNNEHYHARAYENVCKAAERYGLHGVKDDEADMKEVLHVAIREDDSDLVGEIIEWFISDHARKTRA
jgi:hypothetical protein